MSRLLIIDGFNLFIRHFVVNPAMDSNGESVGALMGFMCGVARLSRENVPDRVIVVWDGEGGSTKRRTLFKEYKEGRKPKFNREYDFEDTDRQMANFNDQLRVLRDYLTLLPVCQVTVKGLEADDVIAYICNNIVDADDEKLIVSSDRDFYQLLDARTTMYVPTKKKYITTDDVCSEMHALPVNVVYVKSLVGDRSDNIKGIRGVGVKSIEKLFPFLLERPVEIEEIFEHAERMRGENKKYEMILEGRQIVIDNVRLMQLSSPLMDPLAAKSIRHQVEGDVAYRPTEVRMRLNRDGLQLTMSDFFIVFKEQNVRTQNVG